MVSYKTSDTSFFWVSEEKKEFSPSQILYNKLEKIFMSLCLKVFMHKRFCFFQWKLIAILSTKESDY